MSKPFRSFTCDGFAKVRCFSEGQRTEGHFLYPGASNAITIIVDLRSEHDLKVLLKVGHADSATNMQVIGLTHRPTGFGSKTEVSALPRHVCFTPQSGHQLSLPRRPFGAKRRQSD